MRNETREKIDSTITVFQFLIDKLGYKTSANYSEQSSDPDYDAVYTIDIENRRYTVVGIKRFHEKDEKKILEQHIKYWNRNDVPFSILIFSDEIRIYNNFTIGKQKLLYTNKKKNDDILSLFSDKNIANGLLWEHLNHSLKRRDRVDKYLLNNLRNTIINLNQNHNMDLEDAYNVLAQCIFIKYLEDRKMLTNSAFTEFGVESFNELLSLKNPKSLEEFFTRLKEWFNGDLFDLKTTSLPTTQQLNVINAFFDADEIDGNGLIQYTLFKYDFSKIPIELISNIYETFFNLGDTLLHKKFSSKNGAFYTPYYLANFINDQCFARYGEDTIPKVLDPSCGSGVFLVGAFKRLAMREKDENGTITPEQLKNILCNNIYGIDINMKALKLTCFSLYVALLDMLTPKDILENKFRFPNLIGTSLLCCDFFADELTHNNVKVDILIGNPPWVSDKNGLHIKYCINNRIPISDSQVAQTFVARARDFIKEEGIISLIVTNSIFTNENASKYREYLMDKFQIFEIINLHGAKKNLFEHASAPCSILTYGCGKKEKEYSFNYYAFKPNLLSNTFNKIVFDKDEVIKIRNKNVIRNDILWRILTNGDEYDVRVIAKIKLFPMVKDRNYNYFRGYAIGSKAPKDRPEYKQYKGGNLREGFQSYCINYKAIPYVADDKFERPREVDGYLSKYKLLIKRTQNKELSGAAFCEEPLIFTDDYHCLWSKDGKDESELKILSAYYNSSIFKYYCFMVTKAACGLKPELSKEDILSFPIPNNINSDIKNKILKNVESLIELKHKKFESSFFEETEISDKITDLVRTINTLIIETYGLDDIEKATIDYAFHYVINTDHDKSLAVKNFNHYYYEEYTSYMEKFFDNFLLSSGLTLRSTNIITKNLYTLIVFTIFTIEQTVTKSEEESLLENIVDILGISSYENIESELIVKKRLSGFMQRGFFVIKENDQKNWTKMSAIKDADFFSKTILLEPKSGSYN